MINVVCNYLNDLKRTEDGFYIGYIDTAELYKQFLSDLKEVGFYFSVRDSEKFKEDGQFLFKCNKSNVPVPFSGSPFRREKNIMYQCAYGSQYYGKIKRNETYELDPDVSEKKQLRIRHSKKLGCKAKMAAKCIRIYLDYKISSDNAHWRLKREVISTLKKDLMSGDHEVKSLSRYFVKISEAEQHCHEPIHPKAALKRRLKLARKNIFSPLEVVNAEDCMDGTEIHMLEAADINLDCDMPSQDLANIAEEEDSDHFREQCQTKNKEILSLSYLCQDEEQLKELLVELTRVSEKLNDNVSHSSEAVCVKAEAVEEEVCLSSEIPSSDIIEKDLSFEIADQKPILFEKDISLDDDKNIFFDCETSVALELKDAKKELLKENEIPRHLSLHSKNSQKSVLANQVKVEMQTKALSQNMLEASSLELLQSGGINGENFILLIY